MGVVKINFNYVAYPNKLNLGCGYDIRSGYLNIDFQSFHSPDLIADITNLEMLPSGYYEEIIAQDVLEHIPRTQTQTVLNEWSRLLKQQGLLKIRTTNILGAFKLFSWPGFDTAEKHEELMHCIFGTQAYNGDFHYTAFTETLIRCYLNHTGLTIISIQPKDEWLFDIVAQKL
ncbi:MAG: methyltransferase domain-containing protein [Clostridiaceae bacterium]